MNKQMTPQELANIYAQLNRCVRIIESLNDGTAHWQTMHEEAKRVRNEFFTNHIEWRNENETAQTS